MNNLINFFDDLGFIDEMIAVSKDWENMYSPFKKQIHEIGFYLVTNPYNTKDSSDKIIEKIANKYIAKNSNIGTIIILSGDGYFNSLAEKYSMYNFCIVGNFTNTSSSYLKTKNVSPVSVSEICNCETSTISSSYHVFDTSLNLQKTVRLTNRPSFDNVYEMEFYDLLTDEYEYQSRIGTMMMEKIPFYNFPNEYYKNLSEIRKSLEKRGLIKAKKYHSTYKIKKI